LPDKFFRGHGPKRLAAFGQTHFEFKVVSLYLDLSLVKRKTFFGKKIQAGVYQLSVIFESPFYYFQLSEWGKVTQR